MIITYPSYEEILNAIHIARMHAPTSNRMMRCMLHYNAKKYSWELQNFYLTVTFKRGTTLREAIAFLPPTQALL